jgi:hypothetical protein
MLLTGTNTGTTRCWDAATGKPLGPPLRHGDAVSALALSPDCRTLLTGTDKGTARLQDVPTGKLLAPLLRHDSGVTAVAFSPDGRTILTGSKDRRARRWDAGTGKLLGAPLVHDSAVTAVAFSPDGRTLLTATGDKAVAFAADGRTVLSGSEDGPLWLWDAATGKSLGRPLRRQTRAQAAALAADGRGFLAKSADGVQWKDAATGQPLGLPFLHRGLLRVSSLGEGDSPQPTFMVLDAVWAMAISPDGQRVLTGNTDGTAQLWRWVPPPPDDLDRLRAWVHVRTGKAFSERGVLQDLTHAQWLEQWQKLQKRGGDWRTGPSPEAWHRVEAATAECARHWTSALFHLSWLAKLDAPSPELYHRRARMYAGLGLWQEACNEYAKVIEEKADDVVALAGRGEARAEQGQWEQVNADFQTACRLAPDNAEVACRLVLARLGSDDQKGYRAERRRLLARFGETEDGQTAGAVAWASVLLPVEDGQGERILRLARLAVTSEPRSVRHLKTLTAALYRAGQFRAVTAARES